MGQNQRVEALDYLRGGMAISIMVYHYVCTSVGDPDGNTILGRLGIYGVSLFYIISGSSLFLAYRQSTWEGAKVFEFWKKRLLRLTPVYWIACLGFLLVLWRNYSLEVVLLNLSMSFGFLGYTKAIPAGGWSIGNEICFYLAFPLIIVCSRRWVLLGLLLLLSFLSYVYFAFSMLNAQQSLAEQWFTYIHPLNQVFLFVTGVVVAKFSSEVSRFRLNNGSALVLLAASLSLLLAYENTADMIQLVIGSNRLVFTVLCVLATYSCFNLCFAGSTFFEKWLKHLGEISYSIYMLHSVVFFFIQKIFVKAIFSGVPLIYVAMFLSVPVTLVLASFSYRFIEVPFVRLGKLKEGGFFQNVKIVFSKQ